MSTVDSTGQISKVRYKIEQYFEVMVLHLGRGRPGSPRWSRRVGLGSVMPLRSISRLPIVQGSGSRFLLLQLRGGYVWKMETDKGQRGNGEDQT